MNAPDRAFVDTNVWLYAFIGGQDAEKSAVVASLLQRVAIVVSPQVINEVCVNLIRKANFAEPDVSELIRSFFARCLVIPLDEDRLLSASDLRGRYSLSFWDSLVVASAIRSRAAILFSEDLQHGLTIDGSLRIVNPFRPGSTI